MTCLFSINRARALLIFHNIKQEHCTLIKINADCEVLSFRRILVALLLDLRDWFHAHCLKELKIHSVTEHYSWNPHRLLNPYRLCYIFLIIEQFCGSIQHTRLYHSLPTPSLKSFYQLFSLSIYALILYDFFVIWRFEL